MRGAPEGRDPAAAQGVLMGALRATIFKPRTRSAGRHLDGEIGTPEAGPLSGRRAGCSTPGLLPAGTSGAAPCPT